ncbi:HypC/HybG/HupF family hydrogenase formation chaperone [Meiothermus sp. CFH 77666]|uniref:HypC/HybG/HupF family hydrogenase formation chaperone n=1 Tax=Meiothermus sp. CFH 77666 TaxID=2817942 RepID=UPI001AA037A2|nr:HypC/HybG/HupF family hydrogenase formation chaperone [Meiothermus sp. CFH 77666]MBO1436209.1 HypC/HybG/HupF family hydrogenase formation chaperone [Meiothermus sp. CFH 77666]
MPHNLEFYASCTLDADGCTTCGDVAVPTFVIEVVGRDAVVRDRLGQQATIAVDFFPEVRVGDVLLVHMGVAIAKLPAPAAGAGQEGVA